MSDPFSLVIPVFNEANSIDKVIEEAFLCSKKINDKNEIIVVNDGSNDATLEILKKLKKKYNINIINNSKNYGQSYSISEGIKNSNYDIIVTIDGDGQNNPNDIANLYEIFNTKKYGLVGGIRNKRKDSIIKIISSKIANKVRSFILRDFCKDTGCSLKIFDKKIFLKFPFFDGIHRFLPALFIGYGSKTFFLNVSHRPRISGYSKYGTYGRLTKGLRDIIKVAKIIKKFKRSRA